MVIFIYSLGVKINIIIILLNFILENVGKQNTIKSISNIYILTY